MFECRQHDTHTLWQCAWSDSDPALEDSMGSDTSIVCWISIPLLTCALSRELNMFLLLIFFKWSWLETLAWGRVTFCPVSPATSSTWKAKAPLEWSLLLEAFRWTGRRLKPRSGTRLDKSATEPLPQRKETPQSSGQWRLKETAGNVTLHRCLIKIDYSIHFDYTIYV